MQTPHTHTTTTRRFMPQSDPERAPTHTHVLSHSGPIQAGAEKLGIGGRLRGRLGTLGRGTLGRLLVIVLSGRSLDQNVHVLGGGGGGEGGRGVGLSVWFVSLQNVSCKRDKN